MSKWNVRTPFPILPNNVEYIRITLTKEMRVFYVENYKTLLWEIGEDLDGKIVFME